MSRNSNMYEGWEFCRHEGVGVGGRQAGSLPGGGGAQAKKGEAESEVGQGHSKGRGECWQGGVRWVGLGKL